MNTSTLNTNSYTIWQTSPWRYAAVAFGVIFGGIGLMLYLKEMGGWPSNGPWVMLLMLGLFGLVFLLTHYFATAKMVITMRSWWP